jgi:hypothetical protein
MATDTLRPGVEFDRPTVITHDLEFARECDAEASADRIMDGYQFRGGRVLSVSVTHLDSAYHRARGTARPGWWLVEVKVAPPTPTPTPTPTGTQ